ncbi:MAG: phosphatidate cytidylyltransferase [Candidatus Berkelbacteria bacterium]
MTTLQKRIILSLIGIPIVLTSIFFGNGELFAVLLIIIAIISMDEFYTMVRHDKPIKADGFFDWSKKLVIRIRTNAEENPSELIGYVTVALLIFLAKRWEIGQFQGAIMYILAISVILVLSAEIFYKVHKPLKNAGTTMFGILYVGYLLTFILGIANYEGISNIAGTPYVVHKGAILITYLLLIVWSLDSAALFVGRMIGGRKLCPDVSPKKTRAGSIGGIAGAIVAAYSFGIWFQIPWHHALIIGALVGVVGQLGDLAESALKREMDADDSGNALPGHGGFLDRIDSLLFAGPIVFAYIRLLEYWGISVF